MIKAKCIQKFRDKNNHIYGYRLQDQQGNTIDVTPDQLKPVIKNGKISIINLTLTSDGRLVDSSISEKNNAVNKLSIPVSNGLKLLIFGILPEGITCDRFNGTDFYRIALLCDMSLDDSDILNIQKYTIAKYPELNCFESIWNDKNLEGIAEKDDYIKSNMTYNRYKVIWQMSDYRRNKKIHPALVALCKDLNAEVLCFKHMYNHDGFIEDCWSDYRREHEFFNYSVMLDRYVIEYFESNGINAKKIHPDTLL